MNVRRESAEMWAEWFRCLADPSRILILNLLATTRRPMSVGEIVAELDIGQSTVSHHLKVLTQTCFVFVEHQGTSSHFRINDRCLECFPSAAELVMGRLPRRSEMPADGAAPWATQSRTSPRRSRGNRGHNKRKEIA